jgi:hypothetical protein
MKIRPVGAELFYTDIIIVIIIIIIIIIINRNWVDTRWQPSSTNLHTNSTQNTEDGEHTTIQKKKKNWKVNWEVRAVPRLCELYPDICLTTKVNAR